MNITSLYNDSIQKSSEQGILMPLENSRRARRIATKQDEILKAAAAVFAQKGYRHTSIHDIAEKADIADGTIYNYFENKTALLDAIIEQLSLSEQEPLLNLPGQMSKIILDRMNRLKDQYDLMLAVFPEILGTPELRQRYLEQFVNPVAEAVEKELTQLQAGTQQEINPHLSARMLVAVVLGFQVLMVLGDPSTHAAWAEPEKLAQVWSRFVSMGLRPS
jgi:AcrR family transcriptional regulator